VVRHRPAAPEDPEIADEPDASRPGSYQELLEAFDDFSHALATELERADPEDPAWHWSGDNRVGTSYRRQAHEAVIHRLDAELTAGRPVTPLDAALADDGVAEVLGVMYGGSPPWGTFSPSGQTIGVHLTDTGTDLVVALGRFTGTDPDNDKSYDEDDIALVDEGPEPVASIAGTAADLDTWLWKRDPSLTPAWNADARIALSGDREAIGVLARILSQPLN